MPQHAAGRRRSEGAGLGAGGGRSRRRSGRSEGAGAPDVGDRVGALVGRPLVRVGRPGRAVVLAHQRDEMVVGQRMQGVDHLFGVAGSGWPAAGESVLPKIGPRDASKNVRGRLGWVSRVGLLGPERAGAHRWL